MKLQTSSSLHLIFSQPTVVSDAVTRLIGFLRDQGVHDQKFLDEFQHAAAEAINNAVEHGCVGPGDRFAEVTLTVNSVEVQLEIVNPSNLEEALLPKDPRADGKSLIGQMTADGMHVHILRKALGELSWSYEPGFQERLLNSMR